MSLASLDSEDAAVAARAGDTDAAPSPPNSYDSEHPAPGGIDFVRLVNLFMWLGVVGRAARYLLRFPLWGDESFLALNLIQRGYSDLMKPLDIMQLAPLSFLWLERAAITTFGVSEFSLRAVSLVAGVGGLVLFRYVAGYVLRGWALVFAVGILAVSAYPIRHSAEVKPYACDLFAATLILLPALAWRSAPKRTACLAWLIPCTIVAQLLSFTAVFVAGGVSLGLLTEVWRSGGKKGRAFFIAYNLAIVATFAAVLALAATGDSIGDGMRRDWVKGFPPAWSQPGAWLLWFFRVHSDEALAYPFGGQDGGSALQIILSIIGAVTLLRAGRDAPNTSQAATGRTFVFITIATFGLAFIAALLHRYPYGIGERLQQYWAPFVCILMAQGLVTMVAKIPGMGHRRRTAIGVATVLFAAGVGQFVYSAKRPYKYEEDFIHRSFAIWLWKTAHEPTPLVTLEDLGTKLTIDYVQLTLITQRAMYDKRFDNYTSTDPRAAERRLDAISAGVPLRILSIKPSLAGWLPGTFERYQTAMSRHYRLTHVQHYPIRLGMDGFAPYSYHVWNYEPLTSESHPRLVRRELLNASE